MANNQKKPTSKKATSKKAGGNRAFAIALKRALDNDCDLTIDTTLSDDPEIMIVITRTGATGEDYRIQLDKMIDGECELISEDGSELNSVEAILDKYFAMGGSPASLAYLLK